MNLIHQNLITYSIVRNLNFVDSGGSGIKFQIYWKAPDKQETSVPQSIFVLNALSAVRVKMVKN
jgi:hypothetical protein